MFNVSPDKRLSEWAELRKEISSSDNPYDVLAEFWSRAPVIVHNHIINPYEPDNWPTPWEIIYENKYDDFTLALMISYTLKLSDRYKNSCVEIRTMVDSNQTRLYNLVYVDGKDVLNYIPNSAVQAEEIENILNLENIVEIDFPR
jgi:hypothetical protein